VSPLRPALPTAAAFAALPLSAQLEALGAALPSAEPRDLVRLAGGVADPAPVVWLLVTLQDAGWLGDPAEAAWLGTLLPTLATERAHAVLEALVDAVEPAGRAALATALAAARGACATGRQDLRGLAAALADALAALEAHDDGGWPGWGDDDLGQ
jgi:hypothetical protein